MQIAFKDFVPEVTQEAGFFRPPTYEQLQAAVVRTNAWINTNEAQVINMETVVLPNIHHPHEEGTADPSLHTRDDFTNHWHQFIRVWYER